MLALKRLPKKHTLIKLAAQLMHNSQRVLSVFKIELYMGEIAAIMLLVFYCHIKILLMFMGHLCKKMTSSTKQKYIS